VRAAATRSGGPGSPWGRCRDTEQHAELPRTLRAAHRIVRLAFRRAVDRQRRVVAMKVPPTNARKPGM
jgi:hypothetical protein